MATFEAEYPTASSSKKAKWHAAKATIEKWQREFKKDHGTMT